MPLNHPGVAGLLVLAFCTPLAAQDALRGKRLYLDGGRMNGSGLSCVDCHGGYPGALHGIGKAAGNPSAIGYALNVIGPMAPLRDRLTPQDIVDLAAYLAQPEIPSPRLQWTVRDAAGTSTTRERMELSEGFTVGEFGLGNIGTLPLQLQSQPTISGAGEQRFFVRTSDCVSGLTLAFGQSCRIEVGLRPAPANVPRSAVLSVRHDWLGAGIHLALIRRPR